MTRGVQLIRLPEFDINPANHLLRTQGIDAALEGVTRARQIDRQHDLSERQFTHSAGIDRERLGLEQERLGLARQRVGQADDERVATVLSNMAATVDRITDPQLRQTAWRRIVGAVPRMAQTLRQYGQDPDDHINGPRFVMAQTMNPIDYDTRRAYIDQTRRAGARGDAERAVPEYRINEAGELERASPAGTLVDGHSFPEPAAFRPPPMRGGPAIAGQEETPIPAQSVTPDTSGVPGITLNRPLSQDRGRDWSGGQREADLAQLWPRIQQQDRTLTTPEINRAWSALWGRQPSAGYVYNLRGQEVPNRPAGAGDRGTRDAIRAGIEASLTNISDAREVIERSAGVTGYFARQWGHALNHGEFARVLPLIEVASRSVMHGLSGAQVNIPETQAWLQAFMPKPWEFTETITGKLDLLQGMLTRIQQRQGGDFTDEDILQFRNQMRRTLNLRPLTMQQHLASGRAGPRPSPPPPGQQPSERPGTTRAPSRAPPAGEDNPPGIRDMSDDELKRRLGLQ